MVYVFECEAHGTFELTLPLRKYDDHKPCPKCGKSAELIVVPSRGDCIFEQAIIVHVSQDGKYRFPGSPDARVPKGFEKKELKSIREVESFERDVNRQLKGEAERHHIREEQHYKKIHEQNRSDLRQRMQSMSPLGRAFAEFAIKVNNSRKRKPTDCGFFVEVLHFDQGNREPQRDASTDWRGRKS